MNSAWFKFVVGLNNSAVRLGGNREFPLVSELHVDQYLRSNHDWPECIRWREERYSRWRSRLGLDTSIRRFDREIAILLVILEGHSPILLNKSLRVANWQIYYTAEPTFESWEHLQGVFEGASCGRHGEVANHQNWMPYVAKKPNNWQSPQQICLANSPSPGSRSLRKLV